jgi:DNA-binding response OmpR family regulator
MSETGKNTAKATGPEWLLQALSVSLPIRCQTSSMRLLVVEDDQQLAAALKRGLEAEQYAVDVAGTGTDGLAMATTVTYDLIVLDIMLPGMNGQKLCATLRSQGNFTPILILTAKDGEYDEADSLDLGADDFLSKPFSYTVLLARVRALLRRRQGQASIVVLEAGELQYDPAAHSCTRGEEIISLTAKEASIFEYLIRNVDQVVSKEEILENGWDFAFDGGPNVVEVHVSSLRRKLGSSVIETIRGAGYRISSSTQ